MSYFCIYLCSQNEETKSSDDVSSSMDLTKRYGFPEGLMISRKVNAKSGKGVMNYKIRIQLRPGTLKDKTRSAMEEIGLGDLGSETKGCDTHTLRFRTEGFFFRRSWELFSHGAGNHASLRSG